LYELQKNEAIGVQIAHLSVDPEPPHTADRVAEEVTIFK